MLESVGDIIGAVYRIGGCNYASVGGAPEAYGSRRVCLFVSE